MGPTKHIYLIAFFQPLYVYMNSAVFQIIMHIYHMIAVVVLSKGFKNMFTQLKKMCMHVAYGLIYWYSIVKRISNVWLKRIGNVWLKRIVNVWLKRIGNIW